MCEFVFITFFLAKIFGKTMKHGLFLDKIRPCGHTATYEVCFIMKS